MRALLILFVIALLLPSVGQWMITPSSPVALDSPTGHWLGLLGGLVILLPLVGLYLGIRDFLRWHTGFHKRMRGGR